MYIYITRMYLLALRGVAKVSNKLQLVVRHICDCNLGDDGNESQ